MFKVQNLYFSREYKYIQQNKTVYKELNKKYNITYWYLFNQFFLK